MAVSRAGHYRRGEYTTMTTKTNAEADKKIRQRESYHEWERTLRFLEDRPTNEQALRHIFGLLNGKMAFGSAKAADYSRESLELVLQDNPERRKTVCPCCRSTDLDELGEADGMPSYGCPKCRTRFELNYYEDTERAELLRYREGR
jgi:hypothetical protein